MTSSVSPEGEGEGRVSQPGAASGRRSGAASPAAGRPVKPATSSMPDHQLTAHSHSQSRLTEQPQGAGRQTPAPADRQSTVGAPGDCRTQRGNRSCCSGRPRGRPAVISTARATHSATHTHIQYTAPLIQNIARFASSRRRSNDGAWEFTGQTHAHRMACVGAAASQPPRVTSGDLR